MPRVMTHPCVLPIVVTCASCTSRPHVALAALAGDEVTLWTRSDLSKVLTEFTQPAVQVDLPSGLGPVSSPDDCPSLGSDVVAAIDGFALVADSAGGAYTLDPGWACNGFSFRMDDAEPTPPAMSQLVISDHHTTWTIEAANVMTNDLMLSSVTAGHATITWPTAHDFGAHVLLRSPAGDNLFSAYAGTTDSVTVSGDTLSITFPAGTSGPGTLSIAANSEPDVTRCDGPATCKIHFDASADFAITLP